MTTTAPHPIDTKAQRIARARAIFGERRKILAALFPENGEALVARACAAACVTVNTPALAKASVDSICERVIACHHLGLEIGDQAYVVPYKGEAQLIVGPRGLTLLAYRSGFVKSIYATSVFAADVEAGLFKYNLATSQIRHEKAPAGRRGGGRPEQLISHAYCIIETRTDGRVLEVLTAEDLAYYRGFSKASSGPWFDNYEGMCRKTVLKRGLEFVPRSPLLVASLRETETGGYEIPEDMWEAAKLKASGVVSEQVLEQVEHEVTTGEVLRQPGED